MIGYNFFKFLKVFHSNLFPFFKEYQYKKCKEIEIKKRQPNWTYLSYKIKFKTKAAPWMFIAFEMCYHLKTSDYPSFFMCLIYGVQTVKNRKSLKAAFNDVFCFRI